MTKLWILATTTLVLSLMAQTCNEPPRDEQVLEQLRSFNQPFLDRGGEVAISEKYQLMAESPFAFYRGTAHVFWWDAGCITPENASAFLAGVPGNTWLQGDLHIGNFGTLADNDDLVYFDLNDFDEATLGPWIWDLRRMTTALYLAGRSQGLSESELAQVAETCIRSFADAIDDFSNDDDELTDILTADAASGDIKSLIEKAESQTQQALLDKYTTGNGTFSGAEGDLIPADEGIRAEIVAQMPLYVQSLPLEYRQEVDYYSVKDVAVRLHAGVGSLGAYRYYVLLEGSSNADDDDRILDVKEARPASAAAWIPTGYTHWETEAERVTSVSRTAWENTDKLLGTMTLSGLEYRITERQAEKASLDYEAAVGDDVSQFNTVAKQLGMLTARFVARLDEDQLGMDVPFNADQAIWNVIQSDVDGLVNETLAYAQFYSELVAQDYNAFVVALAADPLLGASARTTRAPL